MQEGPEDLAEWTEGLPGGDQWTYRETDGLCPLKGPLPNNQIWGLMRIPSSVSSCKLQGGLSISRSVGYATFFDGKNCEYNVRLTGSKALGR